MCTLIRALSLASVVALLPATARAQALVPSFNDLEQTTRVGPDVTTGAGPPGTMDANLTPLVLTALPRDAGVLTVSRNQSPRQQRRSDSLWNGVIVGAAAGAMLGTAIGLAISDCSECSGFNVPLTFGVLGAGVGAGIGAGIDALRDEHSPITSAPTRRLRANWSPLLRKEVQAMVAWIRF